jgi:hypothetical protein
MDCNPFFFLLTGELFILSGHPDFARRGRSQTDSLYDQQKKGFWQGRFLAYCSLRSCQWLSPQV